MEYFISAERPEYSAEQNRERTDQLGKWLEVYQRAGKCEICEEVVGCFEGQREASFRVVASEAFLFDAVDIAWSYDQDAIMAVYNNSRALLYGNLGPGRGLMSDVRLRATGLVSILSERPDGDYTELSDGTFLVVDFTGDSK